VPGQWSAAVKENVMLRKKNASELGQENFFKTRSYIYISPFGWQDSVLCGE
jgi:hypothetical protein